MLPPDPLVLILLAIKFPEALTSPAVNMLAPVTLPPALAKPVMDTLARVPTVCRLLKVTPLFRVLPVNELASTLLAVTPVN